MHDAVVVELPATHPELARIHDDADPTLVRVEPEVEHRQHRLHRDREPDLVGELEPAGAVHLLLVHEEERELPKTTELVVAHSGEER